MTATDPGESITLSQVIAVAGELHGHLVENITEFRKLSTDAQADRVKQAISSLQAQDLISAPEADLLRDVHGEVGNVHHTDPQIAASVRQMNADDRARDAGSITQLVLSIAMDSTGREAERAVAEGRAEETGDGPIAHADVEAAIVGAILGAEFGAPAAPKTAGLSSGALALLGGLGGGIAGSVAQAI